MVDESEGGVNMKRFIPWLLAACLAGSAAANVVIFRHNRQLSERVTILSQGIDSAKMAGMYWMHRSMAVEESLLHLGYDNSTIIDDIHLEMVDENE